MVRVGAIAAGLVRTVESYLSLRGLLSASSFSLASVAGLRPAYALAYSRR